MFRKQWQTFNAGDIFLGDKGFCSYFDIAELKKRNVDSVVILARRAPVTAKVCQTKLGPNDLLISWECPKYAKKLAYSREQWEELLEKLFFRDLKTIMGMDVLRCQSPEMICKEILMHFIAYNCIRRLRYEAAEEASIDTRLVSFKGSLQALRNWEPHMNQAKLSQAEQFRLISDLYDVIIDVPTYQ